MAKQDPYFQFPIALLAWGDDWTSRTRAIVNFCVMEVGKTFLLRMTEEEADEIIQQFDPKNLPIGFDAGRDEHRAIAVAYSKLNIRQGSVRAIISNFQEGTSFLRQFPRKIPDVRLRGELVWDCINGGGITYRELSVLAGVYSVIGSKAYPVIVRRDMIAARQLGYASPQMLIGEAGQKMLSERVDKATPLSASQIRSTLDVLEAKGLFVRVAAAKRSTYFSHRMTREEMTSKLLHNITARRQRLAENRDLDQALRDSISARVNPQSPQDRHLNRDEIEKPETVATQSPVDRP